MLACGGIVTVLHGARVKGRREAHPSLSVEKFCKAELTRINRQIWLLRKVHFWYPGPLLVVMPVQYISLGPVFGKMPMFLVYVLPVFGFIYWLNQSAVKNRLLPLRLELTDAYLAQQVDVGWHPDELADHEAAGPVVDDELRTRLVGRHQLTPTLFSMFKIAKGA